MASCASYNRYSANYQARRGSRRRVSAQRTFIRSTLGDERIQLAGGGERNVAEYRAGVGAARDEESAVARSSDRRPEVELRAAERLRPLNRSRAVELEHKNIPRPS